MNDIKQKILDRVLANAPFDGWTESNLLKSTEEAGFDVNYSEIAFPSGIADIVDYYALKSNEKMLESLDKLDISSMKIRERISSGVMAKIQTYSENREAVRKLGVFYALPKNAPRSLKNISDTVNEIWYVAGDISADFNYYTKRLLLAGVYSATILYWLNDESDNYAGTKKFLDKRIEDVMKIQKCKGKVFDNLGKIKQNLFAMKA